MSFYTELKRRNVVRVGIAYFVGSWALAQVAETEEGRRNSSHRAARLCRVTDPGGVQMIR